MIALKSWRSFDLFFYKIERTCLKRIKIFILIFVLIFQKCLSIESIEDTFYESPCHQTEIEFLHVLANAEAEQWPKIVIELRNQFPDILSHSSIRIALNELKAKIFKSHYLDLIKLYSRAIRNHDSLAIEKAEPFTTYYKHYQPPTFLIPDIHLTFDITANQVMVTTDLTIKRHREGETCLILDGKGHHVYEVRLNEQIIPKEHYQVTLHELILFHIPETETFKVKIKSVINPFANDSLEGMYQCGQWLTTQCESEGARRIFFTLDRPDVLSRITTTIIADKERYPYRLSNGNLVCEKIQEDGRSVITWSDPFPKPSYLFACVLGRFSELTQSFKTKSGKEVKLQIYVEPGKETRAYYALFALQKAMEFDEVFFDREYDLEYLKMVGIPDFNSGAMENKGLIIFNDIRLLVDDQSGTDKSYRDVAQVVGHEYFHNWSGNRVTIRNWFEIALKEAFTDLRAMLFSEWLFGEDFIRPKAVRILRENQFPEEISEEGHPLMVESYVDAHSIYDHTTYIKGREVFRTLKNYIDLLLPDGFRKVQNLYFSRYDGQAVTFRELLSAANEILKEVNKDLSLFERWFHQPGTPLLEAEMNYDPNEEMTEITVIQSCPHPKTGHPQEPFQIPFSLELLGKDGKVIQPKFCSILEEKKTTFKISSPEKPIPIFMHGYSAPVIFHYDYTLDELACIIKYTGDSFSRFEAAQNYSIKALKEMILRIDSQPDLERQAQEGSLIFADLYELYIQALKSPRLSPLAKAQLLEIPSNRTLSQALNYYDFKRLSELRSLFIQQLALASKLYLEKLLKKYPSPYPYEPSPKQMQIRELRHAVLSLLALIDDQYKEEIFLDYQSAKNFNDLISAFNLSLSIGAPYKKFVLSDFYDTWKEDKAVFNFWLASQASDSECTVENLRQLELVQGYDMKNPNHIRSIFRTFIANLRCYHDSNGKGYQYIIDKIIEIGKFNPLLAHNYLAIPAFLDFDQLPFEQQKLMAKEMQRLLIDDVPAQTRDLIEKILSRIRLEN